MGKPEKKGQKGAAANFITRNMALRKLQIGLPEFRKLCILKGIYPREPRKKPQGANKTYYFLKDIQFMLHDPIIPVLREQRAWKKKLKRAIAKQDNVKAETLKANKPQYTLNHLIKERYPTFVDAIRDLDDALCLLHLFAAMHANAIVSPEVISQCQDLCRDFQYYVIKTNALRKVFLSIKGIYYQAEVWGQTVTWIVPYKFTQSNKKQVDYKVMSTFLEIYRVLVGFVNFKLFHSIGMSYPLKVDQAKVADGILFGAIIDAQNKTAEETPKTSGKEKTQNKKQQQNSEARLATLGDRLKKVDNADDDEAMADQDEMDVFDEETKKLREQQQVFQNLFKGCVFYISRETPRDSLEFIIRSYGGEAIIDDTKESSTRITHQIVDRDFQKHRYLNREYMQPQWVYDSINAQARLPAAGYAPGAALPPHLSPFVDDEAEGYIPAYRHKLERFIRIQNGEEVSAEEEEPQATVKPVQNDTNGNDNAENDSDEEEEIIEDDGEPEISEDESSSIDEEAENGDEDEQKYLEELKAEKKGNYEVTKKAKSTKSKAEIAREEEKQREEMVEGLMPVKKRRLLERVKLGKRMRQEQIDKLSEKRRKLENGEARIVVDNSRNVPVITEQPKTVSKKTTKKSSK